MKYRQAHCIVTLNDRGLCEKREVYPSINAAKRANRLTKFKVLGKQSIPQAVGYEVVQV